MCRLISKTEIFILKRALAVRSMGRIAVVDAKVGRDVKKVMKA